MLRSPTVALQCAVHQSGFTKFDRLPIFCLRSANQQCVKLSSSGIKKRQALATRSLRSMTYFRCRYLSQTKIEFLYAKCLCPGFSRVEFLTSNATARLELKFLNRICHLVVNPRLVFTAQVTQLTRHIQPNKAQLKENL